jgi:hypothetical protein
MLANAGIQMLEISGSARVHGNVTEAEAGMATCPTPDT